MATIYSSEKKITESFANITVNNLVIPANKRDKKTIELLVNRKRERKAAKQASLHSKLLITEHYTRNHLKI